ncbi:MAG: OmpH family outer membrane protein [Pseudomonadota bacterium]
MRRLGLIVTFWAVMLGWQPSAFADIKIGYVDLDRALQQMPQAKAAADSLNRDLEARQREIDQRREKIQQQQAELERQAATLSEAQRRERERQLQNMILNLQRMQQSAQEELNVKRNQALKELQDRLLRVVGSIGQRGGYTLIVHDKSVLYADRRIDITDQVLTELKAAELRGPRR